MNPYLEQINSTLPRLLALFDTEQDSPTYGMGDRFYWSWKLIDFGNGTFQGAANGLARLQKHRLLPDYISDEAINKRIDSMFSGADRLRRKNGSMEEAFPYESSFCVTALVAFDLLTSMELQKELLNGSVWNKRLKVVAPMIEFLLKADEVHAIISNHLATACAALYKWHALTGDTRSEKRGAELLERILKFYSQEGWFREYEGADPGYQTLCMYYLADLHMLRKDFGLDAYLNKAANFLSYFAHPDGSFGGLYGSRNTRFYYPPALELLSPQCESARVLSNFMRNSIRNLSTVTLASMDEPNLIPMFNAYAWAAALYDHTTSVEESGSGLPSLQKSEQRIDFPEAGLLVRGNKHHYSIIAAHKGGVVASYSRSGKVSFVDAGAVFSVNHKRYSTQVSDTDQQYEEKNGNLIEIKVKPALMLKQTPKPWQFIILRLLNTTVMKHLWLGNLIKKAMVKMLITGKKSFPTSVKRIIETNGTIAGVRNEWCGEAPSGIELQSGGVFKSIHMASAGYWQRGDDDN